MLEVSAFFSTLSNDPDDLAQLLASATWVAPTAPWLVVCLELLLHGSFSSRECRCVIGQRVIRGVRVGHENGPSGTTHVQCSSSMLIEKKERNGRTHGWE